MITITRHILSIQLSKIMEHPLMVTLSTEKDWNQEKDIFLPMDIISFLLDDTIHAKPTEWFAWEAVNQSIIPPGLQINHINCDRQDNSSKNLELVTASENIKKMHQSRKASFNSSYNEDELRVVNTLMAFPIEDDDCEFTKTENKIINKMYYRMCHHFDDTDFPLYRD